ncbi:putative RNA-directed DNA polymerase from transposon BS, partial [Stegodyphus mimosarum]
MYLTLIRPIMLYAVSAWETANKTDRAHLDVLQNKILTTIMNIPWFVRNVQIQNDLQIKSMHEQILIISCNFFESL